MQLYCLKEHIDFQEVKVINEANGDGGNNLYITGPFIQGNIQNRNGRIYPTDMLTKCVSDFKKTKTRNNKLMAPGELSHPPDRGAEIDPERISHYITELNMDGDNGMGKAKISTTPMGNIVRNLLSDGLDLGVSSRGLGRVEEEGGKKVVKEFQLCTIDIVTDPSAPEAYVEAVNESIHYFLDEKTQELKVVTALERLLAEIRESLSILPKDTESRKEKMGSVLNLALKGITKL